MKKNKERKLRNAKKVIAVPSRVVNDNGVKKTLYDLFVQVGDKKL